MATLDTLANRSTGSQITGKAYFETDTNKFIVWNGTQWIELHSDGVGSYSFNISTRDTEVNILATSPNNPSGEVTIAYGTDSGELYIWDGNNWIIYNND